MNEFIQKYNLKLSDSVNGILQGLKQFSNNPNFRIRMYTFGGVGSQPVWQDERPICVGCAATCAIQNISGVTFTQENISSYRHLAVAVRFDELSAYEYAIDVFRRGSPAELIQLHEIDGVSVPAHIVNLMRCLYIVTEGHEESYPLLEEIIKELKAVNL
jgi:hypothetical protein